MAVFATKEFARFARRAGLGAAELLEAAVRLRDGEGAANLGGGVFKLRIARQGQGKSGGFRTIVVFRIGGHTFFVHGFAKRDKANVTHRELHALKALAAILNGLSDGAIKGAIEAGELSEVQHHGDQE